MFALLLAGVMACAPLAVTGLKPAQAAAATPTKVEVADATTDAGNGIWTVITVDYSDGTMRTLQVLTLNAAHPYITVYYLSQGSNVKTEILTQSGNGMQALSDDSAPGVLIGTIDASSGAGASKNGFLYGKGYATSTACTASNMCVVAGLAAKPQTQVATVAAVPITGAPNSDLVLPAALLAAGMVGGGLMLRKRKDRTRA